MSIGSERNCEETPVNFAYKVYYVYIITEVNISARIPEVLKWVGKKRNRSKTIYY